MDKCKELDIYFKTVTDRLLESVKANEMHPMGTIELNNDDILIMFDYLNYQQQEIERLKGELYIRKNWCSVKFDMPKNGDTCLCKYNDTRAFTAKYMDYDFYEGSERRAVTHWQPKAPEVG